MRKIIGYQYNEFYKTKAPVVSLIKKKENGELSLDVKRIIPFLNAFMGKNIFIRDILESNLQILDLKLAFDL